MKISCSARNANRKRKLAFFLAFIRRSILIARLYRMDEILAECDDDDELDDDEEPEKKPVKSKSKKGKVYLQEDEDSILDFTSSSANRNITSE